MRPTNKIWTKTTLAALLTTAVLLSGTVPDTARLALADAAAVTAADAAGTGTAAAAAYQLTDNLQVEVKSLLNETTSEGTKIAVVVKLRSSAAKVAKIPDLELRARTSDGFEYPLQASVFNAHAIRPGTTEELNYMVTVDSRVPLDLSELAWYAVDWYSYPKQETLKLAVPVAGQAWTGPAAGFGDALLSWGTPFRLSPAVDSPLVYTPESVSTDNTANGPVTTVKVLVKNPSAKREAVPDFTVDGRTEGAVGTDQTVYSGKRTEASPLILEAGEQRYIHFAIPTDKGTVLKSFNVMTQETFRQMDAKGQVSASAYSVGRFGMKLPVVNGIAEFASAAMVENGKPFPLQGAADAVDPNLAVSLVELHQHVNEGEGYQTAIAKIMLTNSGELPIPLPTLGTKLVTKSGLTYSGSRQAGTVTEIMPQTSYVVSYAFNMPEEVQDEEFVLKLSDLKTAAPAVTTLGSYRVAVQKETMDLKNMAFYPFTVKLNDWELGFRTNMPSALNPYSPMTYTYKLGLSMDITRQEHVVVDSNFSKMSLELVDSTGKLISVRTLPFTGMNRVVSGKQFITFDNLKTDEQYYPLTVNIYETITTATGEAKRLVGVLKQ
ncbi:hypothetical protein J2T17_000920 [Paenibacillus mucilaginosus]|uniref:hypothetical protein n=1 Tax=Paenibacillus mucilaginosus TaxID=61624 RepID=UPI003D1C61FF